MKDTMKDTLVDYFWSYQQFLLLFKGVYVLVDALTFC